jgi:hypothetical protein
VIFARNIAVMLNANFKRESIRFLPGSLFSDSALQHDDDDGEEEEKVEESNG